MMASGRSAKKIWIRSRFLTRLLIGIYKRKTNGWREEFALVSNQSLSFSAVGVRINFDNFEKGIKIFRLQPLT